MALHCNSAHIAALVRHDTRTAVCCPLVLLEPTLSVEVTSPVWCWQMMQPACLKLKTGGRGSQPDSLPGPPAILGSSHHNGVKAVEGLHQVLRLSWEIVYVMSIPCTRVLMSSQRASGKIADLVLDHVWFVESRHRVGMPLQYIGPQSLSAFLRLWYSVP